MAPAYELTTMPSQTNGSLRVGWASLTRWALADELSERSAGDLHALPLERTPLAALHAQWDVLCNSRNDGEPLSDDVRARLGERFFRPDGQDERGSGLGLSIVQRIAALHGLTVAFGARADGRGMQVHVAFVSPAEHSTF